MSTDYECGCSNDLYGWHLCNNHERAVMTQSKLLTRERVREVIKKWGCTIKHDNETNCSEEILKELES